jgi:DNA-binding NtrC family response regulator
LVQYPWPGNARELENAVERELIVNWGKTLAFRDVNPHPGPTDPQAGPDREPPAEALADLDTVVAGHIRKALRLSHGRVEGKNGAARRLNMHPSTLRKRMRKLNIPYGRKVVRQAC